LEPYFYVIGGYDGDPQNNGGISDCHRFHVEKCEWERIPSLRDKRLYVSCCPYDKDNSIIAIGGGTRRPKRESFDEYGWPKPESGLENYINKFGKLRLVEKYDIGNQRWTRLPNMRDYRSDCSSLVVNDLLFVAGGFNGQICLRSVEYFDFRNNNNWVRLENMNCHRSGLSLLYYDHSLVVVGGYSGGGGRDSDDPGVRHSTCEMLRVFKNELVDERKIGEVKGRLTRGMKRKSIDNQFLLKEDESWEILPQELLKGRSNFGASVFNNNQIIVCGGYNETTLDSCEIFQGSFFKKEEHPLLRSEEEPNSSYTRNGWRRIDSLPVNLSAMSVTTVRSRRQPLKNLMSQPQTSAFGHL